MPFSSRGPRNDNLYVSALAETEFGTEGSYDVDLSGGTGDDSIWAEIDASNDHADVDVDAGSGSDIVYIYAPGGENSEEEPPSMSMAARATTM